MKLTDKSPMPFGKHKDVPLKDVPASYLHWLYCELGNPCADINDTQSALLTYIENNITALAEEYPDGIWK